MDDWGQIPRDSWDWRESMHDHKIANNSRKLFLAMALTGMIFIAEFGGGLWTGSLALLSDSAHVLMRLPLD
jgi:Co/Zn/Cd efflux system component